MKLGLTIFVGALVWLAAITCMIRNSKDDDDRPRYP